MQLQEGNAIFGDTNPQYGIHLNLALPGAAVAIQRN